MIYFVEAVGADRIKIGLTDGDVNKRMRGCSLSVVQRFRHGERVPKGELLFKIEKIFDVAAESFFEEAAS